MNTQRKIIITTTYNELGIIIDTKVEEVAQPNLQPTCNQLATDTINRQQAIDVLRAMQTYKMFAGDDMLLIDQAVAQTELMMLPSAQPETNRSEFPNNWIPCSERLPDTNRDVLLQFSTNMGVGFWENGEWGVNTGDNIYSEIGEGEAQPIAWCELPEQYIRKAGE